MGQSTSKNTEEISSIVVQPSLIQTQGQPSEIQTPNSQKIIYPLVFQTPNESSVIQPLLIQEPGQPIQEPVQPIQEPVQPIQEPVQPIQEPVQPIQEPVQPIQEQVQTHAQQKQRLKTEDKNIERNQLLIKELKEELIKLIDANPNTINQKINYATNKLPKKLLDNMLKSYNVLKKIEENLSFYSNIYVVDYNNLRYSNRSVGVNKYPDKVILDLLLQKIKPRSLIILVCACQQDFLENPSNINKINDIRTLAKERNSKIINISVNNMSIDIKKKVNSQDYVQWGKSSELELRNSRDDIFLLLLVSNLNLIKPNNLKINLITNDLYREHIINNKIITKYKIKYIYCDIKNFTFDKLLTDNNLQNITINTDEFAVVNNFLSIDDINQIKLDISFNNYEIKKKYLKYKTKYLELKKMNIK